MLANRLAQKIGLAESQQHQQLSQLCLGRLPVQLQLGCEQLI